MKKAIFSVSAAAIVGGFFYFIWRHNRHSGI